MLYRLYTINRSGHVAGPPTEYECSDDRAAIQEANRLQGTADIEIWQDGRLVAYVTPFSKTG